MPIVVTGFEPLDILQGVLMAVQQLESGRAEVENQYARAVRREGNQPAQELISKVFKVVPRKWRGIGEIPQSGLGLERRIRRVRCREEIRPGRIIASRNLPSASAAWFCRDKSSRTNVRPSARAARRNIRSARPMVSSEGACAAYYRYRRLNLRYAIHDLRLNLEFETGA